jgi:hypothetical protein
VGEVYFSRFRWRGTEAPIQRSATSPDVQLSRQDEASEGPRQLLRITEVGSSICIDMPMNRNVLYSCRMAAARDVIPIPFIISPIASNHREASDFLFSMRMETSYDGLRSHNGR